MESSTPSHASALPPAMPAPKTSRLAIASVICGPLGFLTIGLSGIAAIITGHLALGAIRRSGGMLTGSGLSITGLIFGYLTVLILPIAALAGLAAPVILRQREMADRTEVIQNLKQLNLALIKFDAGYGSFPCDELAAEIPEFAGLTGPRVLEQLEVSGMTGDLDRLLRVPREYAGSSWYYFPRSTSGPPSGIVLVDPMALGGSGKGSVLRVDGSVTPGKLGNPSTDLAGAIEIPATVM